MAWEDLLQGLMFNQQPMGGAPPPPPPGANFADRFGAAAPAPVQMADASGKDQSRVPMAPPPPPPSLGGGIFGGMKGWDPGETADDNPPTQALGFAGPPDTASARGGGMRIPLSGGGPPPPPPGMLPPGGDGAGAGVLGSIGLTPQRMQMLLSGVGGGLANTPQVGAGGAFMNGLGGSLRGTTKTAENARDFGLKEKTEGDLTDFHNRTLNETSAYHKGTLGILQQNADSLSGYRANQAFNASEKNAIGWDANDIKRQNGESLGDYRERALKSLDGYRTKVIEGKDMDREQKDHALDALNDYRTRLLEGRDVEGQRRFDLGTERNQIARDRMTAGGGATGQTERLIKQLQIENPDLSTADALALTKKAPNGDAATLRREGLALTGARNDKTWLKDPEGTLKRWRAQYGLSPDGTAAPAPPTGKGGPSGRYDPDQSLTNARDAITNNPKAKEGILDKLRKGGIDTKALEQQLEADGL